MNMVNLSSCGRVSGCHHDNMVLAYCTCKFHLVFVAETWMNKRACMMCKTFGVSVFGSASGSLTFWVCGHSREPRCQILHQRTILSEGTPNENGYTNWCLDCMASEVLWGENDSGARVKRCGVESVRCGVAQLNNKVPTDHESAW